MFSEPSCLRLGEREPVGARVQVDVREAGLDVLAHFDGTLVQKRFSVVEEVDAGERRARLVDDAFEEIEIEHAGLPRPGDVGFRCAARLGARDVAGRRALDEHPAGKPSGLQRPHGRRGVLAERPFQRAIATERRPSVIEIRTEACDGLTLPDVLDARRSRVAQHPLAIRIGAAAHDPSIAEHDQHVPRPRALKS